MPRDEDGHKISWEDSLRNPPSEEFDPKNDAALDEELTPEELADIDQAIQDEKLGCSSWWSRQTYLRLAKKFHKYCRDNLDPVTGLPKEKKE